MRRTRPHHDTSAVLGAILIGLLLTPVGTVATAQEISPRDILERVDANMTVRTARTKAQMTITYRDGDVRNMLYEAWAEGTDRSFLEFTAPARDAGSRFLRRGDAMWIFLPRVGKSVRIQGHMLRQGIMGSDFSYGDASENPSMVEDYDATIESEVDLAGRPTYVLYLTAKRDDLSYQHRRIWIDSERWIPLKEELFAKSGKLLKTATFGDVRQVGRRWYPFAIEMNNELQTDTRTTLQILEMDFNVNVPQEVFTVSYLESGF
jgi:outer membrane lipoprotein-sorting protein